MNEQQATASSHQITVAPRTFAALAELAETTGEPVETVLDHAVEDYRRRDLFDGLNADFAALRDDPEAWEEEQRERKVWDFTLADGLADA